MPCLIQTHTQMKLKLIFFNVVVLFHVAAAQNKTGFKGQDPIKGVSTQSRPVEKQWKGVFNTSGDDVSFGNEFQGARLNGVAKLSDSLYSILITAENQPINGSPWYAFKVWSKTNREISIRFTYPPKVRHRYNAKLSKDGKQWADAGNGFFSKNDLDSNYVLKLKVGPDTSWVAAQELITSFHVNTWVRQLTQDKAFSSSIIGQSAESRSIPEITIGNPASKDVILITGRNHPPEVTGHYALQAFVETLTGNSDLAKAFRKQFLVYVVPLLNPDGVDGGFWRHNSGGIDLNRDWSEFNQPESRAVRDFLESKVTGGKKLLFGIDFHSTWDDIYYTVDPTLKGNLPGFVPSWLDKVKEEIPGYTPHVKALYFKPPTYTLFSYLFERFKTESLVYEIGDNTPKDFIVKKGKVSADEFMKLMLSRKENKS
jgi:hypothetical protein